MPVASTSGRFSAVIPPIANVGRRISAATSPQIIQPGEVVERLGLRRKRRPGAQVIRAVQHGRPRLLDVVRRDADEHLRADDRPGVFHRQIFLADDARRRRATAAAMSARSLMIAQRSAVPRVSCTQ